MPNSPSLISSTPCQCVQEFNLQIFLLNLLGTEGFTRQIVSPLLQNLTWSGLHLKSTLLNSKELKGHLVEAKFTFPYQKYAQYVGRYIIHDACGIDPHVVVSSWISNLQHPNITREKCFLLPGLKTLTMTVPTVAKTMRQAVTTQTVAMVGISSSLVVIKIWSFVLQNGVWFDARSRTAHMNEKKSACTSFRKDQHWSASQMENNCCLGKAGQPKSFPML